MQFKCPTCGRVMSRDLSVIVPHTEKHIVDAIRKRYPHWAKNDPMCKRCYEYYEKELHPE